MDKGITGPDKHGETLEQLVMDVESRSRALLDTINTSRSRGKIPPTSGNETVPQLNAIDSIFKSLDFTRTAIMDSQKAFEEMVKRIR